jgi:phage I-like protein
MKMRDTDKTWYFGCTELGELDEDGTVKGIQILKVGSFEHPQYGRIDITPDDLEAFKESFDQNVRRIDLAINYDHTKTVAAGWIKELSIRNKGNELWATPEWTKSGLEQVKGKEYRYFSAELAWQYQDAETGAMHDRVLLGGALTNYPFIKGMQVIEASEKDDKTTPKTKEEKMNLTEIKAELAKQNIDFAEMEKKAKSYDKTVVELGEFKTKLVESETKAKELSEKLEVVKKEKDEIKFKELLKKGMTEGKLTKEFGETKFKEVFEKMGAEFAEKFVADLPKAVATEPAGHGKNEGEKNAEKTADDQLSELAEARAKKDDISLSEAQAKVMDENPELVAKLD